MQTEVNQSVHAADIRYATCHNIEGVSRKEYAVWLPTVIGLAKKKSDVNQPHMKYKDAHQRIRLLLDTASTANFVTVSTCSLLMHHIVEKEVPLVISTMKGQKVYTTDVVELYLTAENRIHPVRAYVVEKLVELPGTEEIPDGLFSSIWDYKFFVTEKFPKERTKVDLLLGVTDSMRFVKDAPFQISDSMYMLPTLWGSAICGTLSA